MSSTVDVTPSVESARRALADREERALQAAIVVRDAYSLRHPRRTSVRNARNVADRMFTSATVEVIAARSALRAASGTGVTAEEVQSVRARWAMVHGTPHEHLMRADYENAVLSALRQPVPPVAAEPADWTDEIALGAADYDDLPEEDRPIIVS